MNNKIAAIIVLLIIVVGGWFIYKHSQPAMEMGGYTPVTTENTGNDTSTLPAPGTPTAASTTPAVTTGTVKEFTVSGGNFYFTPKTMTVNKGDTVKITLKNAGGTHDLKIDEFNVATPRINSGQSATITFVADKTGTFEYYCSVGEHRAMGMFGTLTVK